MIACRYDSASGSVMTRPACRGLTIRLKELKRCYSSVNCTDSRRISGNEVSFSPLRYSTLSSMPTHSPLDIIYVQLGTHLKRVANLDIGFLRRSDIVALCNIFCVRNATTLLCEVCLSGKGRVRPPFRGGPWVRFLQHLVDLFQGKTLCLRDKEVCKGKTDTAETTPHEEDV